MLNANYSSNPYDTTRPKLFFGDRKKLMVEQITQGSGGKSYNPSWNANRKPLAKKNTNSLDTHSIIMLIAPFSFYVSVVLVSLLWVS